MNAHEPRFPTLVATILKALEHSPGNEALLSLLNGLTTAAATPEARFRGLFLVREDDVLARIS